MYWIRIKNLILVYIMNFFSFHMLKIILGVVEE